MGEAKETLTCMYVYIDIFTSDKAAVNIFLPLQTSSLNCIYCTDWHLTIS